MTTTVKAGDVHEVTWVVRSDQGVPVDLTGVTSVEIHVRGQASGIVSTLAATVTGPTTGVVSHTLTGDLAADLYSLEIQMTGPGSRLLTVPSIGFETLIVQEDIA